jgi:Ssp1 endopeptidase immunity protein Rap1a
MRFSTLLPRVLVLTGLLTAASGRPASSTDSFGSNDFLKCYGAYKQVSDGFLNGTPAPNSEVALNAGLFVGYVMSARDAWDTQLFCSPERTVIMKYCEVVVDFIDKHPEYRDRPAQWIVCEALQEAFPCPNSDQK